MVTYEKLYRVKGGNFQMVYSSGGKCDFDWASSVGQVKLPVCLYMCWPTGLCVIDYPGFELAKAWFGIGKSISEVFLSTGYLVFSFPTSRGWFFSVSASPVFLSLSTETKLNGLGTLSQLLPKLTAHSSQLTAHGQS